VQIGRVSFARGFGQDLGGYSPTVPEIDGAEGRGPDATDRLIAARRRLPGSRATVGGLLVAVAGEVLFVAARPAPHTPSSWYLIASHPIPAGTVLRATDLAREAIDLPASVAAQAVADADDVVGSVTLSPLARHQLLARAGVAPPGRGAPRPVLSFAVDPDRAAGGDLVAGDHIDLLVTWSHDAAATTQVVGHDLTLVAVRRPSDQGLGGSSELTLSVAVPDTDRLVPLVRAVRAGDLTVVRTTGAPAQP
jgi:Flp pilus assembly protein CpaB